MGTSPMHARLLHMFSGLHDVGHSCKLDNLFNSVDFARHDFALPTRVLTDGVLRKSQHGVLPIIIHEEVKSKKGADQQRGTLKVAVLKGDSKSYDRVIVSNYDQKPFYMISYSILEIVWAVCERGSIAISWARRLCLNSSGATCLTISSSR